MARPKANIDWEKVDMYLKAQCNGTGIAAMFNISANTFYLACQEKHNMGFSEYSAIKKAQGQEMLRAKMFMQAMEGDRTMQIWLSKQYLDMKDQSAVIQTMEGMPEVLILPASTAKPAVYDEADIIDPTEK